MAYNQPLSGNTMPRCAGPGTMMRLPMADSAAGLDACFVGIPLDIGTSWRAGTRFGPKQIRAESSMLRPYNMATGAAPFDHMQVADIGDVAINTFDLKDSVRRIADFYHDLLQHAVVPLTLGGDHTLTYPILQAVARRYGPVALLHIDAHADINAQMFGEDIAHGTPFRRAYEEGLLRPEWVYQVGLRGTGYAKEDFAEARRWGFTVVQAEALWQRSLAPLAAKIKQTIGQHPLYISFDIDSLDPAYAPGTGTPEIGGLTTPQALQLLRGLRGMRIVGCDLVEVSPPYDVGGITALTGANLLFEMLCLLSR